MGFLNVVRQRHFLTAAQTPLLLGSVVGQEAGGRAEAWQAVLEKKELLWDR